MIGDTYGQLTVIAPAEQRGNHKRWLCQCACGNQSTVWQLSLRRGTSTSCGCAKRKMQGDRWATYRVSAFWKRVDRQGVDACWPWIGAQTKGAKNPTPYGQLGWRGKVERAHRVAFELVKGEIQPDAMVLHTCDNTLCCNPKHLYIGDHAQNMRDMVERQRRKGIGIGAANGRAKLNQKQANEIRNVYAAGIVQQDIADAYGVSQNAISKIILGKRYT